MLKSCSLVPTFFVRVNDPIWNDARAGTGYKYTYFYWFSAQVPFSLLLVNFLAVWEIRFFFHCSRPKSDSSVPALLNWQSCFMKNSAGS